MKNQKEISADSYTFGKAEKLCSKKVIDQLFLEGKSFLVFPVKVVFLETPLPAPTAVQSGFSVSKKIFKRAIKRNRMKRLMREAFRLNKNELYRQLQNRQLAVFFIYVGKELLDYNTVERAMKKAMLKIGKLVVNPE